jgi:hypothetical protein
MEKETLEEAAENNSKKVGSYAGYQDFIEGAKWQAQRMYSDEPKPTIKQVDYVAKKQERMYSEEDLDTFRKFMIQEQNYSKSCLDVFIKQFKKK